jgi:hypothetical protein
VIQFLVAAGRNDDALQQLPALEADCAHLPAAHPITAGVRRVASQLQQQP